MRNDLMVSINCITYNHQKYIAETIDSFLMQKTNFKFEILIHDDASTDQTPEIIKQYEMKYPHLVKPIYQTKNQYSKGVHVEKYNLQRAKAKYIAVCEGDDYWTDQYKLQKQVNYLESHPECTLCVHESYVVDANKKIISTNPNSIMENKIFTVDEIIKGGGGAFATNSMVYRTKYIQNLPDFYKKSSVGDYPLMIYLALQGNVYYMKNLMSAYRSGVEGSWTSRNYSTPNNILKVNNNIDEMLDAVNEYSKCKYDDIIKNTKRINRFNILIKQAQLKELKKDLFKDLYLELKIKTKIKIIFKYYYMKSTLFMKSLKHD